MTKTKAIQKLLAANRSEIAIRIFRAANELGLRTVGIYSQEDRLGLHRFKADEAYQIGENKGPVEAYLDVDGIVALAADTDGIDGTEDNAGALIGPDSLARAAALGLDPRASLAANDSYGLFAALGDLVVTGPTRTNVNDFRAVLVT